MNRRWNLDHWPIIEYDGQGAQDLAVIEAYLETLEELLTRGPRLGLVNGIEGARYTEPGPSAAAQIEWMAAHEELMRRQLVGIASLVCPDGLERAVQESRGRQRLVPVEGRVFADRDAAVAWLTDLLAAADTP